MWMKDGNGRDVPEKPQTGTEKQTLMWLICNLHFTHLSYHTTSRGDLFEISTGLHHHEHIIKNNIPTLYPPTDGLEHCFRANTTLRGWIGDPKYWDQTGFPSWHTNASAQNIASSHPPSFLGHATCLNPTQLYGGCLDQKWDQKPPLPGPCLIHISSNWTSS